jgi:hypothetical protein
MMHCNSSGLVTNGSSSKEIYSGLNWDRDLKRSIGMQVRCGIISVTSWHEFQLRTLDFLEIDILLYDVYVPSRDASRGFPHHFA